ncbi:MAG: hypothetical protein IJU98_12370 [Synergistaceae bacterium]|nr:hypothetical protein [Synergistaceae bacterium]
MIGLSVVALCLFVLAGGPRAEGAWDISGSWLVEGVGFAEKEFVRVSANLEGVANFYTVQSGDIWCLTGYDLDLTLYASRLGINAWSQHMEERFQDRIPLPETNPSLGESFKLPAVTKEGLTCQITFTSATSGTVAVDGTTNMGSVGDVKVGSDSAIWKEGTEKPDVDKSKDSGCRALPVGLLALLAILPFLFFRFRVK